MVARADRAAALQRLGRLRLAPAPEPPPAPELAPAPGLSAPEAATRPVAEVAWCVPGVHHPPDRGPSPAVHALLVAVDDLQAADPTGRAVDCAVLLRAAERLRGLALRELAELDVAGEHLSDGSPTTATWLRDTALLSDATARATVRLATRLRDDLPALADVLVRGGTTLEHVRAVAAETGGLDRQVVRDSQVALCALVSAADPATVRATLRERADALRPELGRDKARRAHDRRGLYADDVLGSSVHLSGSLGAEDGQVLLLGLDLACEADRTAGDRRTLPQRRADVLVQWARDAAARIAGPGDSLAQDAHTIRTHLLITCTPEQLRGSAVAASTAGGRTCGSSAVRRGSGLPGGGLTRPAGLPGDGLTRPAGFATPGALLAHDALRRLACDATVSLLASDGATGTALYVGRSSRTVTGAQWKALVARDRHCVVRGCRRRPAQCEAHHVRHWLDGGATDLDNLVLLCHAHHHDHHDRGRALSHRDGRWLTSSGWAGTAARAPAGPSTRRGP